MGMYTDLKVKIPVKQEFIPVIDHLVNSPRIEGKGWWEATSEAFPQHIFLKKFAQLGRADFIPFGGCFDFKNVFTPETGVWDFYCSLKNYEGEIEAFIRDVLPHIVDRGLPYEVASLYEESERWRRHKIPLPE